MSKNFIPVICCSSNKTRDRFCYEDRAIKFVASPQIAPKDGFTYYKPDNEIPGKNKTWRDLVLEQNHPDLIPAYRLYSHTVYSDLYHKFGNRFYILSGGWGLIRADFKIPAYDITYSTDHNVPEYARRRDDNGWNDFNHLKEDSEKFDRDSEVIYFAGSDYQYPFFKMTKSLQYKKITTVVYLKNTFNEKECLCNRTDNGGCFYSLSYRTNNPRNWHYRAALEFLSKISSKNFGNNQTTLNPFSFFGFQSPPENQKKLEIAYQKKVKKYNQDTNKIEKINDMYDKALKYFKYFKKGQ